MITLSGVEGVGAEREVVVILRKDWNPRTAELEDVRETLALDEAQERRQQLEEELADLDAWIEDATPQVETFRSERTQQRAEVAAAAQAEAEYQAELERQREQEREKGDDGTGETVRIIHPKK